MAIKNLEKMDIYNPTNYVNNSEPDIDADNLNKTENKLEETVAKANEIIDALKTLISTVQANSDNTVPSSSLAYAMQQEITKNKEDIATANSNLGNISDDINPLKSNYVSHININVLNKVNLVLWDANTADTPFKAGNTVYGNGFCITYSSGVEQWLCQLAMAVGDSHLFTRHQREGVWSGWTTIGSPSS